MDIEYFDFGQTTGQETVQGVQVKNGSELTVSLINWGATLISVKFGGILRPQEEITINLPGIQNYEQDSPYLGSTIGRVANRMANGSFELDGQPCVLYKNDSQKHHLHGGKKGFDKVIWDMSVREHENDVEVEFSYCSKDGEEGYPGTAKIKTIYRITNTNEIIICYEATVDRVCPIVLTNHTYWNLSGNRRTDILNHQLQLHSKTYLPTDESTIPTGEIAKVEKTVMDFQTPKKLGKDINQIGGYDHYFIINKEQGEHQAFAELFEAESGRKLSIYTTEPGFQMYSGNYLDCLNQYGIKKHDGVCIETHGYPNAVNQAKFPNVILRPGEIYRHQTRHRLKIVE